MEFPAEGGLWFCFFKKVVATKTQIHQVTLRHWTFPARYSICKSFLPPFSFCLVPPCPLPLFLAIRSELHTYHPISSNPARLNTNRITLHATGCRKVHREEWVVLLQTVRVNAIARFVLTSDYLHCTKTDLCVSSVFQHALLHQ